MTRRFDLSTETSGIPDCGIGNAELNEKMEFAHPSSISPRVLNTLYVEAAAASATFKSRATLQAETSRYAINSVFRNDP